MEGEKRRVHLPWKQNLLFSIHPQVQVNPNHSRRCTIARSSSREGTSIPLGHHSLRVNIECRVHPGDSTSSRLHGSISTMLPDDSIEGWSRQSSLCHPAEPAAIAIWITLSLDCPDLLGYYFINISVVSLATFLPHLLAVIIEGNAPKHSLMETNQNARQTQPLACQVWEDQKVKLKVMARNGRRNIQLTSALTSVSPSVLPSMDTSF